MNSKNLFMITFYCNSDWEIFNWANILASYPLPGPS